MAVARSVNGTVLEDGPNSPPNTDYTGITVNSDTNQALILNVVYSGDPGATTATWDQGGSNQSMPQIVMLNPGGGARAVAQFGCVNPIAGNKTLRVTVTNDVGVMLNATSYKNCDQTGGATTFHNTNTNSGTSATVSLAITTVSGEATVDSFTAPTGTATPNGDNTLLHFLSGGGPEDGGSSEALSVDTSNTHSWAIDSSLAWLTCGCSIKATGATAAITGTATASITEADIVTGGKTIIATLTGDTYVVNTITPPVIEVADCTLSGSDTAADPWSTVAHPACGTGDLLIWYIAWDDSTSTTDVAEPAGQNSEVLSEINATPITDSATETRAKAWYTITTGAWTAGNLSFNPSATESWSATVIRVPAGEFDAATPIGTIATRTTTVTNDTAALSPAMTAGATDGDGRLIWCAGVDADPLTGTVTGWTILKQQDLGAVSHGVAIRNAAVTDNESIAGGDTWTIVSDSWTSIGFIVRAPTTTTFENARQAFINGLDSGQAEGTGWDAVVKAGLATSTVVRTSSTVVTCTLSAFASYNITAQETITATIPASILSGAAQIVATPTFTVDTAGAAAVPPSVNETMGALVESVNMHMPIYVKMEKVP